MASWNRLAGSVCGMPSRTILPGALCWFLTGSAVAQSENAGNGEHRKSVTAVRALVAPRIDGKLDDVAWTNAALVDSLHMVKPDEFGEPTEHSRFLIVYDDDTLYVAARFFDSDPAKIIAKSMRHGSVALSDDLLSVIIDPFERGDGAYQFELNPNGVRTEAVYTTPTNRNYNWKGLWNGAARVDALGWTAELAIPFKTISFDADSESWGVNFSRWIGRKSEQSGWVSRNRAIEPTVLGRLYGIEGITQGNGIDVVTSITADATRTHADRRTDSDVEPALDVIYRIVPSLVAAVTINTDFTGTNVDIRQINLTRFALFRPEQREFFLQDADVFEFGNIGDTDGRGTLDRVAGQSGRPYFSRRIGLSPARESVDIVAGAKLTGRFSRWDTGLLNVRQDAYAGIDRKNLFVARASLHVLDESRAGIILTHGDSASNADNGLVGVDFNYRNTGLAEGRSLLGSLWAQQSATQGMPGDDVAYGGSLSARNNTGFRWDVRAKVIGSNFNPGVGFVSRSNVEDLAAEIGYTWRPTDGKFRSVYAGFSAERIEKIDGGLESERLFIRTLELENRQTDRLFTWYLVQREHVAEPFEVLPGLIIEPDLYSFGSACASLSTGAQRDLSANVSGCTGDFYDGKRDWAGIDFTWRPNAHLGLAASYEENKVRLSEAISRTTLATLRFDVSFNVRWSWETFLQYDNVSDVAAANSILRWVPAAGRELVLVLNHEQDVSPFRGPEESISSNIALKWRQTIRT